MSALEQWHRELGARERTVHDFDALWESACREADDREFDRQVSRPQREHLEQLRTKHAEVPAPKRARRERSARLTKWRHAFENAEAGA